MISIIIKETIFLFITVPGIVGNIFIFVKYANTFFWDTEKHFIHLIVMHLTLTNFIIIFCKLLPKMVATFGLRNFLGDAGCQILIYLERMGRGLSLCTTSLLTMVQAIIMSPKSSMWARFKPRSAWHLLPIFLSFWILNSLISLNLFYYIKTADSQNKSIIHRSENYCYFKAESQEKKRIFLTIKALRDGLFQSLMGCTSVYVMFLLHKHHQLALHLRNPRILLKNPPEIRAAHSVLLLMCCFLFFYWAEYIVALSFSSNSEDQSRASIVLGLLTIGYASLSPFVLIHRNGRLAVCLHI